MMWKGVLIADDSTSLATRPMEWVFLKPPPIVREHYTLSTGLAAHKNY